MGGLRYLQRLGLFLRLHEEAHVFFLPPPFLPVFFATAAQIAFFSEVVDVLQCVNFVVSS